MKNSIKHTSGDLIRDIRVRLCLEQKQFAGKLGITVPAVSHYECGRRFPALPILKKIMALATEAGVSFDVYDFVRPKKRILK